MERLPNAEVMQRLVDSFISGDQAGLDAVFADDAVWHEPGRAPFSGDQKGKQAIFGMFGQVMELSGGTFRPDVHDICASESHGVVLFHGTGKRNGREMRTPQVLIAHIKNAKLTEIWNTISDGEADWNAFWS